MNKFILWCMIVLAVIACSAPEKKPDPIVASIDSVMNSVADTAGFNGNILVAKNGEIIYRKSFGYSNYDTKEMLNDSSMFELASVSKAFTAMSIMMLKEEGKLSYDDDVRKYLPELPYQGMTIRHFLQHTSGIPDYEAPEFNWQRDKIGYNADILKTMAEVKPAVYFKPGEKWQYSNSAYALLAIITERVSGQSFSDFLSQRIFEPLNMTRSRIYNTRRSKKEIIPNYAFGYVYSDSLKKYMLPDSLKEYWYVYSLDGIYGDGVVNSTTGDLFKWNKALYTDQLVPKATLEEAFVSGKLNSDSLHNYGFGWFIENDSINGRVVSHTGGWPGYGNLFTRFLDRGDCIIVLTNNGGKGRKTIKKQIAEILAKKEKKQ